jgi:hypothetical protein
MACYAYQLVPLLTVWRMHIAALSIAADVRNQERRSRIAYASYLYTSYTFKITTK